MTRASSNALTPAASASLANVERRRHYGTLLDGATAGIAGRLDTLDAERDRARAER